MKILLTAKSLLASYGGPAFSVSALACSLAEAGADVGLWATDGSAAETRMLQAGSPVLRLSGTECEALKIFGDPDVLHDNGIWLPHNRRLALLASSRGIPRVVSTRGMLNPWALRSKRLKKRLAWLVYQRRNLEQAQCHHATSEAEMAIIQSFGMKVPVVNVRNGVDLPEQALSSSTGWQDSHRNGSRKALFLGRLYPVKGLPMLIQAWALVRPFGWHLDLAGPDEAGHRQELEREINAAGLNGSITFIGPLERLAKQSAFFNADLFILPSHSESFGMVVAEALAHGVPVLTTTGAPWPVLSRTGCGWWVDPSVDGIAEGLRQATILSPEALRSMGSKGRTLMAAEFSWKRSADLMLSMYHGVLAKDGTHDPFAKTMPRFTP